MWITVAFLLWFVLREVDLRNIWTAVGQLNAVEIGVLVFVKLAALAAMSSRWWIIIRSFDHRLSLFRVVGYRLTAFSISYFTPGPHFGGEPFQAHLLRRRLNLRGVEAAATVALDKSIELVANFTFQLLGLTVLLGLGLFPSLSPIPVLTFAAGLLVLPILHLTAAARGHRPLAGISDGSRRGCRRSRGSIVSPRCFLSARAKWRASSASTPGGLWRRSWLLARHGRCLWLSTGSWPSFLGSGYLGWKRLRA